MKILCICPIGIGNYLLCYPAFVVIKKAMPSAFLHLLALRSGIAGLAQGDPLWNGITTIDPTKIASSPLAPISVLAALRAEKFDASLNFFPSNTWQYNLFPYLAGVRRRYGFSYQVSPVYRLQKLCNNRIPVDVDLHDVYQNYRLAEFFLQKKTGKPDPVFPVIFTEEERRTALLDLETLSVNKLRIAVHPGSSAEHGMDAKRWPPDKFAGLTDMVCREFNAEAYIFGGPGEESIKNEVATNMRCAAHVIPPAPLSKTAALLSGCSFCICNDSGLMHIASCMGVPTAGIFGPTDEKRNGPFGRNSLVIRKNMEGFPVWTARNVGCRALAGGIDPMLSLKALSVEEAWAILRPWIVRYCV
ncbi:MAG TPA: hypothetical protein DCO75_12685 [Fibrobacteres bacterium]|jgi:ADP-heptose:LPS heptosyltransferase|nr:hypothetical protein [Fibrobacterota bacterium]